MSCSQRNNPNPKKWKIKVKKPPISSDKGVPAMEEHGVLMMYECDRIDTGIQMFKVKQWGVKLRRRQENKQ